MQKMTELFVVRSSQLVGGARAGGATRTDVVDDDNDGDDDDDDSDEIGCGEVDDDDKTVRGDVGAGND